MSVENPLLGAPHIRGELLKLRFEVAQSTRWYARYYNYLRTHQSLGKNAPISRAVERLEKIESRTLLGGLHHHGRRQFCVYTAYTVEAKA